MRYSWPWGVSPAYSAGANALPRISIVTPNYNGAKFLEATIRSVICQGYPNLQYIIADGASTDGSLEIIDRYRDHIAVVISEPDRGHGDALNRGFAKADGEILAWLNSDDMYLPWALHTVAEIFTAFPHVRWIEGLQSLWDDLGRLHGTHSTPPVNQYDYLLGRYEWIQQESVFWTRSLWEDAGGRIADDYKLMIDGELWTRFFLHAPLYRVDYALSGFRMHTANRSHDKALLREEMTRAIDKMRTLVAPSVADKVQRFARMQNWLERIPSLTLKSAIVRKLARPQLEEMGYDVIWRDISDYKTRRIPFSYSRLYSW
jgi:glycosyltransferase involved in cell wall biosynthesis